MDSTVNVFIGGTGAMSPFADAYYMPVATATRSIYLSLPWAGLLNLNTCYSELERRLDDLIAGRDAVIIGHSQGGVMALIYAMRHPNVRKVIALSAPIHGTTVVRGWMGRFVESSVDMAADCEFSQRLVAELESWLASSPSVEIDCVYTMLDMVVKPSRSSYISGARNYVFAPPGLHWLLRMRLPKDVECLPGVMNHLSEPWDPVLLRTLSHLVHRPVRPRLRLVSAA